MGKLKFKKCIYCGKPAETKDHAPPKSFFPEPKPTDLITVPSCLKCNNKASIDEELFLATFMLSSAGESDAGKALWDQKVPRMFNKNKGVRSAIARKLKRVDITTAQGIFIERRTGIELDQKRNISVIEKIVRALYYFEYKQSIPLSHGIRTLHLLTKENYIAANDFLGMVKDGSRSWPGVFQYKHSRTEEGHLGSMWFLHFYNGVNFWVISIE